MVNRVSGSTPINRIRRRRFLAAAGMALAGPAIIPASVLGKNGATAPSNRVSVGVIGCGSQGPANTEQFLALKNCQVVAACDVDKEHLENGVRMVNQHYDNRDCAAF